MLKFITDNAGTIATALILTGIVTAIILKLVHNKKHGKSAGCGCGCSNCPKASSCSSKPSDDAGEE